MQPRSQSQKVDRNLFLRQYTEEFVRRWDELIDWQGRAAAEDGFFQNLLDDLGLNQVLDIACGTGFHAVMLAKDGFEVVASDGSPNMVNKARENAARFGLEDLDIRVANWLQLTRTFTPESFDAVICLGNALTHLHEEADQRRTLAEVYKVLRPGGAAIIDQRNYDKILDRGYSSKHQYYYLGSSVEVVPEQISPQGVRFRYQYKDGQHYYLNLYPIRQQTLTELLLETGFQEVARYGDFKDDYATYDPDFIVQVAIK